MPTHYEVLGLKPDADLAAIKSAHRRLAKNTHSDVADDVAPLFLIVQEAYEVLRDPGKRASYDRSLGVTSTGGTSSSSNNRYDAPADPGEPTAEDRSHREQYPFTGGYRYDVGQDRQRRRQAGETFDDPPRPTDHRAAFREDMARQKAARTEEAAARRADQSAQWARMSLRDRGRWYGVVAINVLSTALALSPVARELAPGSSGGWAPFLGWVMGAAWAWIFGTAAAWRVDTILRSGIPLRGAELLLGIGSLVVLPQLLLGGFPDTQIVAALTVVLLLWGWSMLRTPFLGAKGQQAPTE